MAKPKLQDIFDQSRALLGDDTTAGGQIFTNTVLQPHVSQAIREIYRVMRGTEDAYVLTDAYYLLPANTVVLDPATAGLPNFDIVEWVEWQLGSSTIAISGVTIANALATVTTATPHGLSTGATVVVFGIVGFDPFNSPNNLWTVTVTGPSTLTLNGCTASGTYTSGGQIAGVTGQFITMDPVDRLTGVAQTTGSNPVTTYAWEGGVFRFYPSSNPMMLRIVYRASATLPTGPSSIIAIDDSQDYLATRAAGLAARARGADEMAENLTQDAIGPAKQADGNGGLLRQLVQVDVRNLQRIQMRMMPFRARRTGGGIVPLLY